MKSLASVRGTPAPGGRLLAPQDREAFSLSRGFPHFVVSATADAAKAWSAGACPG